METIYDIKGTTVSSKTEMSRIARRKRKKSLLNYVFKTEDIIQGACSVYFRAVYTLQRRETTKRVETFQETRQVMNFINWVYVAFFLVLFVSYTCFRAK